MNSAEAADLISRLHGAFPGTYFDEPVAEAFANSFITNDYDVSKQAVANWINTMERFPTIAELNREIRRLRQADEEAHALPAPAPAKPDLNVARAAFARGYRMARERAGDTDDEIERKLAGHLNRYLPDAS